MFLGSLKRWLTITSTITKADAIVVLGGGLRDRALLGAALYEAGYASRIIVSGGLLPFIGPRQSWANLSKQIVVSVGVPASDITVVGDCYSTWQEAERINQLNEIQGLGSIILVSDRIHGRRAVATFSKIMPTRKIIFCGVEGTITPGMRKIPREKEIFEILQEMLKVFYYWHRYGVRPWKT